MAKILVIDDDLSFRSMLESRFTDAGYDVETAANGNQALEKLELYTFDLLVSDVMMPDMDGIELVKKLRSMKSTSGIPVIFLTGSSYSEINVAWLKEDLKHKCVLPKTCTWETILQKAEEILKKP